MTVKQFKNRFKKSCDNIENELDKIIAYSEELDDLELGELIQEIVDNVRILIIENTTDKPTDKNLASYFEYLEEAESIDAEYSDEDNNLDDNDEY